MTESALIGRRIISFGLLTSTMTTWAVEPTVSRTTINLCKSALFYTIFKNYLSDSMVTFVKLIELLLMPKLGSWKFRILINLYSKHFCPHNLLFNQSKWPIKCSTQINKWTNKLTENSSWKRTGTTADISLSLDLNTENGQELNERGDSVRENNKHFKIFAHV
jgi:hypothetical protein